MSQYTCICIYMQIYLLYLHICNIYIVGIFIRKRILPMSPDDCKCSSLSLPPDSKSQVWGTAGGADIGG